MSSLTSVADLKYNCSYRFFLSEPKGDVREGIYIGKERLGNEDFIKVTKLNGSLAASLAIETITDIEVLNKGSKTKPAVKKKAKRK